MLVSLGVSTLILMAAVEGSGRLLWERFPPGVGQVPEAARLTVPDSRFPPASRVRMTAGREAYETDEDGRRVTYRTIPFPGDREMGIRDDGLNGVPVGVVLGDSFTFGAFVDLSETFTEILERDLGVDVLNLGVGSYGPDQSLHLLEHYVARLDPHPRWVLYVFYSGNDLLDLSSGRHFHMKRFGWQRQWLDDRSVGYRLLKHVAFGVRSRGQAEMRQHVYERAGLRLGFRPSVVLQNSPGKVDGEYAVTLQALGEVLLAMRDASSGMGARFSVAIAPYKEQVYREALLALIPNLREADLDLPGSWIEGFCKDREIPVLDLTGAFRRHVDSPLYFTSDDHWNASGHALAARLLVEWPLPGTKNPPRK